MNKTMKSALALAVGLILAVSVSTPASAVTLTTGAKNCIPNFPKLKTNSKYSVENYAVNAQYGGSAPVRIAFTNGSTYTVRVAYFTSMQSASSSWANGPYLSSASISC